jgi:hypothetical protein
MSNQITLDQKLRFIGFRLNVNETSSPVHEHEVLEHADIERTLIEAAYVIRAEDDYRLFSILLTWIKIFGEYVIVEKFEKLAASVELERGPNPILNAIAVWGTINKQTKWKRLISRSKKNQYIVDKELTESSAKFPGFKADWLKFGIKVPAKMLRERDTDVLTFKELASKNIQFKNRLLFGAGWRSDIITANEIGIDSVARIEKILGCSHEPAYRITKEYRIATDL